MPNKGITIYLSKVDIPRELFLPLVQKINKKYTVKLEYWPVKLEPIRLW